MGFSSFLACWTYSYHLHSSFGTFVASYQGYSSFAKPWDCSSSHSSNSLYSNPSKVTQSTIVLVTLIKSITILSLQFFIITIYFKKLNQLDQDFYSSFLLPFSDTLESSYYSFTLTVHHSFQFLKLCTFISSFLYSPSSYHTFPLAIIHPFISAFLYFTL